MTLGWFYVAAAVACPSEGEFLADSGFEIVGEVGGEIPNEFGFWGQDRARGVGQMFGIDPFEGARMLQLLYTGFDLAAAPGVDCGIVQLVDLSEVDVSSGQVEMELSAWFNRIEFDAETDNEFHLRLRAHAGQPQDFIGYQTPWIDRTETFIATDSSIGTWERNSAVLQVPAEADYLSVWIVARENVVNDRSGIELDGHFADAVSLKVTRPCKPDLAPPFGDLDVFDVLAYLGMFSISSLDADWNCDGLLDIFDVVSFLGDFEAGC